METRVARMSLASLRPLDVGSRLPLYAQLAERLSGALRGRQAAKAGTTLPTEAQIMAHFGISRPTVRQAMAQLVQHGLVTRSRGRGTFVAPERLSHDVRLAFEDEMRAARKAVRFQLLRQETGTADTDAQALGLPAGAPVMRFERLRFLDDVPFAHERRCVPATLAARISHRMLERLAIISLLEAAGERPARITNTVRCVRAEPLIARLLGLSARVPLLQTEHVYYAADGTPMLHGIVRFQWDRMQFTMDAAIDA